MIYDGKYIWLSFSDFAMYEIGENTLFNALQRNRARGGAGSWEHKADPSDRRRKLVKYCTIPESTRILLPTFEELLGQCQKQIKAEMISRLNVLYRSFYETEDVAFFFEGNNIPHHVSLDYAQACAWLRLLGSVRTKTDVRGLEIPSIEAKKDLREAVLEILKENPIEGLKVANLRVLQRHEQKFKEKGRKAIISGKYGNSNSQKLTEDAKIVLLSLYAGRDGVKRLPGQVYDRYNELLIGNNMVVDKETGEVINDNTSAFPKVSHSTVRTFLGSPYVQAVTSRLRHGQKYFNDWFMPYVIGKPPKYALSMTSSDGEKTAFFLKKGNNITWKRPTAYLIFDVYSQCIIGFALGRGKGEDKDVVQRAYADMLQRTGGYCPLENQQDNHGRFYKGELEQFIPNVSFCKPNSPQSKYAEPLIGRFEQQVLRLVPGFAGSNIQAKKQDGKRNPDLKRIGYTWEEIEQIYLEAIETWNNSPAQARGGEIRANLLEKRNPDCQQIDLHTRLMLFGHTTKASIKRKYITIEHRKAKYKYEVPQYESLIPELSNGWRVRVRVLEDQIDTKAWIYNMIDEADPSQDVFLREVVVPNGVQRAKVEQTPADKRAIGHFEKSKDNFEGWVFDEEKIFANVEIVPEPSAAEELDGEEAALMTIENYTDKEAGDDALAIFDESIDDENEENVHPRWG